LPNDAKPQALSFADNNDTQPIIGLDASCPILFKLQRGKANAIPPIPTQVAVCSLFDHLPFLEIETPELASIRDSGNFQREQYDAFHQRRCIFLESSSLHLGILAPDKKTWIVRHVASLVKAQHPVLLNWPETTLQPGEKTTFTPRILGGNEFQAEMMNRPKATSPGKTKGTIEVQASPDEFASLSILQVKLQQNQGNGPTYQIPIMLAGPARPVLAPADFDDAKLQLLNSGVSSPDLNPAHVRGLSSRVFVSQEAIVHVPGLVNNFAILQLASNKVQFLSLESGTITQTLSFPQNVSFITGAGALYAYDTNSGELVRIEVPQGTHSKKFSLPKGLSLVGIGVGKDPDSPLTLLIEGTTGLLEGRIGDYVFSTRSYERGLIVVDNRLSQNLPWAQPIPQKKLTSMDEPPQNTNPLGFALFSKDPTRLPTSFNGRVISMPGFCAVIGAKFSTWFPFSIDPTSDTSSFANATPVYSASGSLSGIITAAPDGTTWKAGSKLHYDKELRHYVMVDPSGRYKWIQPISISSTDHTTLDLRLVETNKLLAKLTCLPLLEKSSNSRSAHPRKRAYPLNEEGLMALLNPSGRVLQLLNFNFQDSIKTVANDYLHVVSQPQFYVAEGHTFDYQIRVNSPELVLNYLLQTPVEGALLDEKGLLHYAPPADVKAPAKVNFTIEVKAKSGAVFIHEFPVQILALPKAAPPKAPPPAKVSI